MEISTRHFLMATTTLAGAGALLLPGSGVVVAVALVAALVAYEVIELRRGQHLDKQRIEQLRADWRAEMQMTAATLRERIDGVDQRVRTVTDLQTQADGKITRLTNRLGRE